MSYRHGSLLWGGVNKREGGYLNRWNSCVKKAVNVFPEDQNGSVDGSL